MATVSDRRHSSVKRVVVTGGAGFLGSHICEALVAQGAHVICVDDLSTSSKQNVAVLEGSGALDLVVADVSAGLEQVTGPVSAVLHLASPASPPDFLAHPLETMAAGAEGTRHALALATAHGARFLLASSSEVYGEPAVHPQPESYWGTVNPIGLRSVYDEAKRFAEALTMAWHRTHGTNVVIARIFNTYGPRMRSNDGRVVSNFLVQAIEGRPLTVYGDGTQTRSLCFVEDMVVGLLCLLESGLTEPVNIGNPDEHTMRELANLVLEVTESTSAIVYEPLPEDDPTRRRPDITLARRELAWEPVVTLRDGLCRTADYFKTVGTTVPTAPGSDPRP